jgi:electron transfer flavoprotein alpha subunit
VTAPAVVVVVDASDLDGARPAEVLTLAAGLGAVTAIVTGAGPADERHDDLATWGAVEILRLAAVDGRAQAAAVADLARGGARAVLLPGTRRGTDLAALVAFTLGAGVVTGATSVAPDLTVTKRSPDGAWLTTVVTTGVLVATVAPGAVAPVARPVVARQGTLAVSDPDTAQVRVIGSTPRPADGSARLADAAVVIAAGRGTGGDLAAVRALAAELGAAVAGSRAAVDEGWLPHTAQVGQTGADVAPDVYLAVGVSGATQHVAGMHRSRSVVAVNTDPQAPIFGVADLGIVGDLHAVLGRATAELRAARERAAAG